MKYFFIIIFPLLLIRCTGKNVKQHVDSSFVVEELPAQESWNSTVFFTDSGKTRAILTAGHLQVFNTRKEKLEELLKGQRAELQKLEATGVKGHDPLMPTTRMPSVGTEYFRKLRDVKYNEMLFELLSKQYEIAKLDEARDAAIIQVIDKAIPPERRISPNRKLIMLLAIFISFFLSVLLAFLLEFFERSSEDPENRGKMELIRKYLKSARG